MTVATTTAPAGGEATSVAAGPVEETPRPRPRPNIAGLSGTQRAALVLMQLGRDRAARILARLSDPEIEEVTAAIVRMERIDRDVVDAVIGEFHETMSVSQQVSRGGLGYATQLLEGAMGAEKAGEMLERLQTSLAGKPFEYLQQADARQVIALINGEHPQTVALVLAHLRPEHASQILTGLQPAMQAQVAHRIALMERAAPDIVAAVADALERKSASVLTPRESSAIGGVQPLVEIINRADPSTEKLILEGLEDRDADLADEVRSRMFVFADIVLLEDRALQLVMRGVDAPTLALALKGAGDAERDAVLRNMSERARTNLVEEIELLGPVRVSQVEEARSEIVQGIRRLEEAGQIVITREGEDEYVS
ncbi:flagellar motor switch protein FliG [Sanguibacter sp. HDW7]|uniref:flagellar motor switch protein FliG n=1 Tax=Sanguibacter sp. HDW7 TaxID=2714931 RepID=UPI00140A1CF1|nr:flagellar motor switch protein FliG [Sanguibacter sp. HDW7]QIK84307.1 flagellar motor switch protein FliG [Sanguibacter sp. HDW7]